MSLTSIFYYILPVCGVLGLLYYWGRWIEGHFERHGVKHLREKHIPLIETTVLTMLKKIHFLDPMWESYRAFPNEKYVGFIHPRGMQILIRDLDLLKQLTIKDFDHFHDHISFFDTSNDSMFGNSLVGLKGQKWRDMRATLSPAFTSSKMRNMFSLVAECAQQTVDYYLQQLEDKNQLNKDGVLEIEMKDSFTRYNNDVIASTAFGVKTDSLREKNNLFYEMGSKIFVIAGGSMIKLIIFVAFPKLAKALGISLIAKEVNEFFRKMVGDTMKIREEQKIQRPDMIQLLMEAKNGSLKHETTASHEKADAGFATVEESYIGKETVRKEWSDDEIAAQAFIFFLAGFDTASSALSFMSHELAINPEVQVKLQQEIDDVIKEHGEKLDYNILHKMKYMDMVLTETLRMWPPAMQTDRNCNKAYTLPPPNDSSDRTYRMEAGTGILIPIYAIHHDPQYFPEPQRFDPERFSDDNKDSIHPFAFMPFGVGPRNCIGSRFALMEAKAVMFCMLAKFHFQVISKTQIPLRLQKGAGTGIAVERGFWIGLKRRRTT